MEMTVIHNTIYAHAELWEDPSCPSIPNRIPSHWEVYFGGEYSFMTDETIEELEADYTSEALHEMIFEECEIDPGVSIEIDYTLKDGICTIKIINAEFHPEEIF